MPDALANAIAFEAYDAPLRELLASVFEKHGVTGTAERCGIRLPSYHPPWSHGHDRGVGDAPAGLGYLVISPACYLVITPQVGLTAGAARCGCRRLWLWLRRAWGRGHRHSLPRQRQGGRGRDLQAEDGRGGCQAWQGRP